MRWRPLKAGEIFEGRYRIEAALGSGGFSYVYRATQLELGRQVALKVLRPFTQTSGMDNEEREQARYEWVERFRREAQIVSRLRDPHTITMYEYGQTASGMSFMAFEYIAGSSLSNVIRQESPIDPQRLGIILRQCLSSLQEAHSLGMLHRDIKPANIMLFEHLGRTDQIKVLDFGIAKALSNDDGFVAELTQAGAILGTPRYMSPEQLRGNTVTPASDIYSLALVAYELLTGDKAIGDTNTIAIITSQLSSDPIRLPDEIDVPYGLATIIHHMLAKDPAARYQDAAEVLEDLDRWLDGYRNPAEPTSLDVSHAVARATAATAKPPHELLFQNDDDTTHNPSHKPAPYAAQYNPAQHHPPAQHNPAPQPEPAINPLIAAPPVAAKTKTDPQKHRWLLIAATLLLLIGIVGFIFQKVQEDNTPIQLAKIDLSTTPEATEQFDSQSDPLRDPQPELKTAAGFMVIVTDPARAEILINDKSIGTSPQRVESSQFNFPIFVKARLPDGRETSEALTEPTDLFELRLPPPSAVAPGNYRTTPSTLRPAPATTNAAAKSAQPPTNPKPAPQSASKPAPQNKPRSSFPALDSM